MCDPNKDTFLILILISILIQILTPFITNLLLDKDISASLGLSLVAAILSPCSMIEFSDNILSNSESIPPVIRVRIRVKVFSLKYA